MSPTIVRLRARTLEESMCLRVHAGFTPLPGWRDLAACQGADFDTVAEHCDDCQVRMSCLSDTMLTEQGMERDYIAGHFAIRAQSRQKFRLPRHVEGCGTTTGYHRHRRNGETACDPCKAAWALSKAERQARAS